MAFYRKSRPPRVFLGVREVAGYYANLERGFAALGVPCTRLITARHRFEYAQTTWLERQAIALSEFYATLDQKRLWGLCLARVILTIEKLLIAWVIRRHDIFIFGAMTSLRGCLSGKRKFTDLRKIARDGKTAIFVFHGSEVRPPWLNGTTKDHTITALIDRDAEIEGFLARIEPHCDAIVSHPPMAVKQRKPFAQYLAIGVPFSAPAAAQGGPAAASAPPQPYRKGVDRTRILHAPSLPEFKGTAVIEAMLQDLQADGHLIDYIKIAGMPHRHVLAELGQADLVIDQVYSDTPMAHFATEAAFFGVPSVVCGLDLHKLDGHLQDAFRPPSRIGHPDALRDLVLDLIQNPGERRDLGAQAQAFVRDRWAPEAVAQRFLDLASGKAPSEWFHDPTTEPPLTGGWGMSVPLWKYNVMRHFLYHGLLEEERTTLGPLAQQLYALCMAGLEASNQTSPGAAGETADTVEPGHPDWRNQLAALLIDQGLDSYRFTSDVWRTELHTHYRAGLGITDKQP